ncbi:MAG: peptidoglycan editing factor PgeF [Campylobacterota bacterium]|nr:peptidoglycan editing factor PgeF [Campylobacterota bacterium]
MIFDEKVLAFISTKEDGNIAFHVPDDPKNVIQNRQKLAGQHQYNNDDLIYMEQIHSSTVHVVNEHSSKVQKQCDAMVSNTPNLPLMVMVADCIPLMFYDAVKKVIAVAHAGRNGVFLNIAQKTVHTMMEEFDSKANDIQVYIGPSIQQCCYEVNDSLAAIAVKSFGKKFVQNNHLDLQAMCTMQLQKVGIDKNNMHTDDYCTKCHGNKYFSYRQNCTKAGRFCVVLILK